LETNLGAMRNQLAQPVSDPGGGVTAVPTLSRVATPDAAALDSAAGSRVKLAGDRHGPVSGGLSHWFRWSGLARVLGKS
jgi:hypothetical protein